MAAGCNTTSNTGKRHVRRGQPEKYECDSITGSATQTQQLCLAVTGTCRFKGEALAGSKQGVDTIEHQPTGRNGAGFRIEWRKAACDFVRVQEFQQIKRHR